MSAMHCATRLDVLGLSGAGLAHVAQAVADQAREHRPRAAAVACEGRRRRVTGCRACDKARTRRAAAVAAVICSLDTAWPVPLQWEHLASQTYMSSWQLW